MSDVESTSVQVGDHYSGALDNLRSTVKWLVASAGAVAAAIIAGAQLVDYSGRNAWGVGLAALAVVVALSLTIALLLTAAKILTVPRPTVVDLANTETRSGANKPGALEKGEINDPNVLWLLSRRSYVLGPYRTVEDLLSSYREVNSEVAEDPESEEARKSLSHLRPQIEMVEEAAHYRDMAAAYDSLVGRFGKGAIVFILAVVAFSISGLLRAPDKPLNPVTKPVPVRVVTTNTANPTPRECRDRLGVAIDGTLASPTVVMPPTPQCAATTISPQKPDYVVIPQVSPKLP
ncbi:hypothetical protein [Mycolicibacterium septicum]|uniref:hypothetical protein n=1 Tax=Mycolicibacterium septicum TaxID=98668 RepID=UPI002360E239|nr:hypothetical protein [Mycolicibacterium septicum]